jgi:polar amino acid transport system permease protein
MVFLVGIRFDPEVVWEFLFDDVILLGARETIWIAVIAQTIGILLGIVFAVMRVSRNPLAQGASGFYVWFVRGTPVLLQLLLVSFGLRQMIDNEVFREILTRWRAAVITFSINEGAYMTEIVRAGIQSIPSGQMDAARSLGMTNLQAMRRIILPQALRVIIPPTGNEFIAMLKNTSIAFAIGVLELSSAARRIYADNFKVMELLVVAAIWYLLMTTVFSLLQAEAEAWASAGRERPRTLGSRLVRALAPRGRER